MLISSEEATHMLQVMQVLKCFVDQSLDLLMCI